MRSGRGEPHLGIYIKTSELRSTSPTPQNARNSLRNRFFDIALYPPNPLHYTLFYQYSYNETNRILATSRCRTAIISIITIRPYGGMQQGTIRSDDLGLKR
jgi:hypothetical protein